MAVPVSVVIPFRGELSHLAEALDSVRKQTAPPEEIIVVLDGASGSGHIGPPIADEDVRLVTLAENRGPGPARNAGVAVATQPYIAFLDADDMWMPDKLRAQHDLMRAWPQLDATHTDVVYFRADGSEFRREWRPTELTTASALQDHVMSTPTVMIKRAAFERIGGFDPAFRCTQDWDLQIRMAAAGYMIRYLPRALARVRRADHGNHSANWRCYLAGHLRVAWKHRGLYRAQVGRFGWIRRLSLECARGGDRRGGLLGAVLRLPWRLGIRPS